MNKKDLRKYFKSIRKHNTILDKKIKDNLLTIVSKYHSIACYMAINEEISLNDFIKEISLSKEVYLPYTKEVLEFRKFTGFENLIPDQAGILAPNASTINVNEIDVIIIACIACNYDGYRLGYGKGYYDGALKDYKGLKVGVTYDETLTDVKFQETHDIRLDYIVTPTRIIKIG